MAFIRCDVASSGPVRYEQLGEFFPRCEVAPGGAWVSCDCHADGSVYVDTSAAHHLELGPRPCDKPACVRYQTDGLFHLYMVAWDGTKVYGRHLVFTQQGQYREEREAFDASGAGSQGILDVTVHGEILWWDAWNWIDVDGLVLRNARERGDYIVGNLQETYLGNSVFVKSTGQWYRAWAYDTQLLPGIAEDGTVASQGEGGGFTYREDWLTRPFDPHVPITPIDPPIDPIDPPIDPIDPPIDPIDPVDPEPTIMRSTVLVDKIWFEVEEVPHPDAGPTHGPVVAAARVSDGHMLKVRTNGHVEFEAGTPGGDERLIPVPGAYVALRDVGPVVIEKAGPWAL